MAKKIIKENKDNVADSKKNLNYEIFTLEASNIRIKVDVNPDNFKYFSDRVLREYQKELNIPGFRKGQAPLDLVMQQMSPAHMMSYVLEEMINKVIKKISGTNAHSLIGEIYNIDHEKIIKDIQSAQKDNTSFEISFDIDIYPDVKDKNDNYKTIKPELVDVKVEQSDIDQTYKNILKNYAEYKEVATVNLGNDHLLQLEAEYMGADDSVLKAKTIVLSKKELEEKKFSDFVGLKTGDNLVLNYDSKLDSKLDEKSVESIQRVRFTAKSWKELSLPELNDAFVTKITYGQNKTVDEFNKTIEETLLEEKRKAKISESMDKLFESVSSSFDLKIPKTFVDRETAHRMENMKKQYKGFDYAKYLNGLPPAEKEKFDSNMRQEAEKDIYKFMIMEHFAKVAGYTKVINENGYVDTVALYEAMTK